MELLAALGLDWKILLAQFINFAILVFVLWKFGYKPIMNFLDERKKKIEQGVEDAQKATEKLEQMEVKEKEVIANAKKEAIAIIDQAKEDADKKRQEMIAKAKEEVKTVIDQEKAKIKAEREETTKQIKKEVGELIAVAVEKVVDERLDQDKDRKMIEKVLKEVK